MQPAAFQIQKKLEKVFHYFSIAMKALLTTHVREIQEKLKLDQHQGEYIKWLNNQIRIVPQSATIDFK